MNRSYFACGVTGCDFTRTCSNPDDIRRFNVDRGHMINHYKWDHAPLFGIKRHTPGVAFSDWYDYGPIPDEIGPTFFDATTGDILTWKDIRK